MVPLGRVLRRKSIGGGVAQGLVGFDEVYDGLHPEAAIAGVTSVAIKSDERPIRAAGPDFFAHKMVDRGTFGPSGLGERVFSDPSVAVFHPYCVAHELRRFERLCLQLITKK